ncbi:MAG: hypothetical protein HY613_01180 [Candidatus Rokubacteria bacterium]|nr:hypothetical protein [Candidatus Rokubacteria bacterium]
MIRVLSMSLVVLLLTSPVFAALEIRDEVQAPVRPDEVQAPRSGGAV